MSKEVTHWEGSKKKDEKDEKDLSGIFLHICGEGRILSNRSSSYYL